jgi:hypothetical protein
LSRTALVRAIKVLQEERPHHREDRPTWPQRLDAVSEGVPKDVVRRAKDLLSRRDRAVYDGAEVISGHAQAAFETVIEYLNATFGRLM